MSNISKNPTSKSPKFEEGEMPSKKLPLLILLTLCALSLLRLLRITTNTSPSPPPPPPPSPPRPVQICSSPISTCIKLPLHVSKALVHYATSPTPSTLTPKELRLLSNFITQRAPCNLLVFGFEPQAFLLSALNADGTTIFLEDSPRNLADLPNSQGLKTFNVDHRMTVNESYRLLKHARMDLACAPHSGLRESRCPLALTWLPEVVYKVDWDVVVVDGPSGDSLEAPGRMGAIYSAAIMARAGKMTDVFVHDVDRTVERWYSWEFLCEENLIDSKGKLWHFRIISNGTDTTGFCSGTKFRVE